MNGTVPSHVPPPAPSFGEAVDHIEEWFWQWETNLPPPIAMDLYPTAQEDERHESVMSADLPEAKEYLQSCSLQELEDLQRRLGRVGVVTRVKHGDTLEAAIRWAGTCARSFGSGFCSPSSPSPNSAPRIRGPLWSAFTLCLSLASLRSRGSRI
jgi:hypothetical protein